MANAEQVKSLIKAHINNDQNRFTTLVLQIAAYEAKLGHSEFAFEIRDLIDKSKASKVVKLKPFASDFGDLILEVVPAERKAELIVSEEVTEKIDRILLEYKQSHKLYKYGMTNRRKILLVGVPGTGKTMTASVIAQELKLPLYVILMDKLMTKFMGETGNKLRQIFEVIEEKKGVYFFDEFDTIGGERAKDNDVGEMRRVLNSFLHFIDKDKSDSLILAASNNLSLLDQALFRRFDDIITYSLPSEKEIIKLLTNKLSSFKSTFILEPLVKIALGLSHAEITSACQDAIKDAILRNKTKVEKAKLIKFLEQKRSVYAGKK
ncbi:AAA family ATPase [Flavihumibacter stibioxidans]|uniref:ATPase n=1 Tax=Flavihumibacter stibioxidans TaxID=1834163 RepID=A0ABR7M8E4_9BACT|nr:ATP-binding protein [Flavihumibacter stibioxidans]MBC6491277.1 ATPase [Flavihumibacter stibioxidans]